LVGCAGLEKLAGFSGETPIFARRAGLGVLATVALAVIVVRKTKTKLASAGGSRS
jgi:hypothetical protein